MWGRVAVIYKSLLRGGVKSVIGQTVSAHVSILSHQTLALLHPYTAPSPWMLATTNETISKIQLIKNEYIHMVTVCSSDCRQQIHIFIINHPLFNLLKKKVQTCDLHAPRSLICGLMVRITHKYL